MVELSRPPPLILFVHNHTNVDDLIDYLTRAGLRVARTGNQDDLITHTVTIQPDLIVLDFAVDGDTAERLKGDVRTRSIPLIALAEMVALQDPGSGVL